MDGFAAYKAKNPQIKGQLKDAARKAISSLGGCSIHLAYELAVIEHGLHCSRSWLPAFARELVEECPDIARHITTRRSQFDGRSRA